MHEKGEKYLDNVGIYLWLMIESSMEGAAHGFKIDYHNFFEYFQLGTIQTSEILLSL